MSNLLLVPDLDWKNFFLFIFLPPPSLCNISDVLVRQKVIQRQTSFKFCALIPGGALCVCPLICISKVTSGEPKHKENVIFPISCVIRSRSRIKFMSLYSSLCNTGLRLWAIYLLMSTFAPNE